jgi:quinol monooxygenase YgiN
MEEFMSEGASWMLELEIKEGREAEVRELAEEMVSATKADEPGTLDYEWSISSDEKQCHIFERYVDSAAVMTHVATFGEKYAARFLALLKPVRMVVYGSPSAAVQAAVADFQPIYMQTVGGFSR